MANENGKVWPHYFKAVPKDVTHVDIYWVCEAWNVSAVIAHAVKKLLCPGSRGTKTRLDDLKEARATIDRAIELEMQKQVAAEPAYIVEGVNEEF